MIGVDWGTTNFRAYRFEDAGQVIERRFSAAGILNVKDGRFAETLHEKVGDWIAAGEMEVLLCGMVGSRQGWLEVDYLPCPVKLDDLAAGVVNIPYEEAHVKLIPGVRGEDVSGVPEVMRGEETQVMGLTEKSLRGGLVCMPGTHTKWIELRDGTIESFQTCMTGDVFAALRKATILSKLMHAEAPLDEQHFLSGIERSAETGGVLHHLFGVRTLALMGELREEVAASYLSGLLIGHEVRAMMPAGASVHIVGAAQLSDLYRRAIESCGGEATIEEEDAAARGLAAIGRRLDWRKRIRS
ncbi:MAG TPA: 2-dehydro-3-deoxygalactonokinase [Edaphobacter sp.]|nr:2-dehydro-3-deoxygalactonokinase [Edaphobacter sp.]